MTESKKQFNWFEALFYNSIDPIYIKNSDLVYIYANNGVEKIFGLPASRIIGKTDEEILGKKEADQKKLIEKKVLSGRIVHQEHIFSIRGQKFFYEIKKIPIRDNNGKIIGISCFGRDISALKKIEFKLKQEKEKAQQYLNLVDVIILGLDYEGNIFLINKKGLKVLGAKEEGDVLGLNWFENFLPKEQKNEIYKIFSQIINGQLKQNKYHENIIVDKGGKEKIIAWHNTLLHGPTGEIIGTLSSGEDITERKRAEEKLKKRTEELERFVSIIVNRELKMIELKKEIKRLKKKKK